ncbi:hypothetical protein BKA19_2729 [Blastococcus saxobsidens]|uniref:Uncharacterized protein n=2 Tax=Blastococcus saxobsidens TaxID=138336 RepID=A0A4Q7Y919_9ACTN|nr:hypothetical protein BKA19_2729 [Blastococcus saxobsidens]
MLVGMDASAAWLVLGTVLGVLLSATVVAGVLAYRWAVPPAAPEPGAAAPRVDDLADFLEHPPGTRTEPPAPADWAMLAAPPPAPAAPPPATADGRGRTYLQLAALSLTALTLVGVAAAVAAATGTGGAASPAPAGPGADPDTPALEGELRAAGIVLEQRAVGVTATYPEIRLRDDGGSTHLELRLPTWNCFTASAPADPAAAGCVRSVVEHAELSTPELVVEREGERLRLHGRAATELRPFGTPPEPSGHAYEFEVTVTPRNDAGGPVTGEVRIGTNTAPLVQELSELDAD